MKYKGYYTDATYMGIFSDETKQPFPTEKEYDEMLEEEDTNEN